jgi:hypothetical protein
LLRDLLFYWMRAELRHTLSSFLYRHFLFPLSPYSSRSKPSNAANYGNPEIELTMDTESCTNKLCLEKVLKDSNMLEDGDGGERKNNSQIRWRRASSGTATARPIH